MSVLRNRRGYSPAPLCYGWTCPCGHHSISAVGPVPSCAKCGTPNPARATAERERLRRRKRSENLHLRLIAEAARLVENALSEPASKLPTGVEREAEPPRVGGRRSGVRPGDPPERTGASAA